MFALVTTLVTTFLAMRRLVTMTPFVTVRALVTRFVSLLVSFIEETFIAVGVVFLEPSKFAPLVTSALAFLEEGVEMLEVAVETFLSAVVVEFLGETRLALVVLVFEALLAVTFSESALGSFFVSFSPFLATLVVAFVMFTVFVSLGRFASFVEKTLLAVLAMTAFLASFVTFFAVVSFSTFVTTSLFVTTFVTTLEPFAVTAGGRSEFVGGDNTELL